MKQIENQRIKENAGSKSSNTGVKYDYDRGQIIANILAETLYTMKHGESNTAVIKVSPRLMFGTDKERVLESHLGKVVDILPSDKDDDNMELAIRGMLSSIHFTYNAGASASCSYEISLTRVRRYNKKENPITCQLYIDKR
jgi:hypothetical protein